MVSLIPNEKFKIIKFKYNILFYILIILFILFFKSFQIYNNLEIYEFSLIKRIFQENSINLNKLYNFPTNIINILLITFLFFILIVNLKITNFFLGPFRKNL